MSSDSHAEAFKTFLAAATQAPVYDHDEAQALGAALPAQYTIVYVSRRFGGVARMDGTAETPLRRLQTRVVARTVTNARLLEDRAAEAFQYATVDLGGGVFTHVAYETGGGLHEYDDGYYSDLTNWTYSI